MEQHFGVEVHLTAQGMILTYSTAPLVQELEHATIYGAIVAQKLRATDGFYISQLNVTISSDMIGKSVGCAYTDGQSISRIGAQIIRGTRKVTHELYSKECMYNIY